MRPHALTGFLDVFLNVRAHGMDTGLRIFGRPDVRKVGAAVNLSLRGVGDAKAMGRDLLFTPRH